MNRHCTTRRQFVQLASLLAAAGRIPLAAADSGPIDIGDRRELFVDDFLVDTLNGARRTLHRPVAREVSLARNKPWEGNSSGYTTVFQDGDLYRMYYRGTHIVYTPGKGKNIHPYPIHLRSLLGQDVLPSTGTSSSSLPDVLIAIQDTADVCERPELELFTGAPELESSSEPFDVGRDDDGSAMNKVGGVGGLASSYSMAAGIVRLEALL